MTFDVASLPWGSRRVLQDGEHPKVRSIGRCALSASMLRWESKSDRSFKWDTQSDHIRLPFHVRLCVQAGNFHFQSRWRWKFRRVEMDLQIPVAAAGRSTPVIPLSFPYCKVPLWRCGNRHSGPTSTSGSCSASGSNRPIWAIWASFLRSREGLWSLWRSQGGSIESQ